MRILFVNKNILIEHLGMMSISSILKGAGYRTELVEARYGKLKDKLQDNLPTILAFSTPTVYAKYYLELNRSIKKDFKVFSVFGGPHPTFCPEMIDEEGVDAVCIGEGEYAMLELVDNLTKEKSIRGIKNWWIKEDGKIFRNDIRSLIDNLDNLPFPDRELFRLNQDGHFYLSVMRFITSRGCPFNCSYCFNHAYRRLYGNVINKVRRRTVDNVIEELREARSKYKVRFVRFNDDTFISSSEWTEEFCHNYKSNIGLPFCCNVRPDLVTSKIVNSLKLAGCRHVSMGIETADDYLRNTVLRKDISRGEIIQTARLLKKEGIKLWTHNLLAIPYGSIEKDIETLKLNIKCKPEYAFAFFLTSYPKTDIYKLVKETGLIEDNCEVYTYTLLPSVRTQLKFKNIYEKRRVENLQKLFGVIVNFPFLLPFVRVMISLPLSALYFYIYLCWFRLYADRWILSYFNRRDFLNRLKKLDYYIKN